MNMEIPIIMGSLFWIIMVFIGSRKIFEGGSGSAFNFFYVFKRDFSVFLPVIALVFLAAAGFFVYQEILAIRQFAGMIGPLFFVGVVLGVLGAQAGGPVLVSLERENCLRT